MAKPPKPDNIGVAHGVWGEEVAATYLRLHGYEIIDRNVRPVVRDRRLEIDIIAYDRLYDVMAFVEVKQHRSRSPFACRQQSVDRHKRELLRRACRAWLAKNHWEGGYRFDIIEVYGEPYSRTKAEIDHIPNVRLFADDGTFVNWQD